MTLRRYHSRILFVLTLALATTACRQRPNASFDPYAALAAQEVPAIEQAVGLKFKHPPTIQTHSKAQVRQFVLKQLTDPRAQHQLQGMATAYKLFGMIPDTLNLQKFLVDLLAEQVVGFYDPETKVLYVVQGSAKDAAQITVTHELVHALQDQYVNLDSIQKAEGDNDRQAAAQAVLEGQAVYEQLEAMLGPNNGAINLPGGWDRVRQMIRDNQAAMPVYAAAPLVIQETLVFPYLSGAEFIREYKAHERGGVPYSNMPVSTSQILHPNAFFQHRDDPTRISFAPVPGVHAVYDNDLGEFETRLFLYQYLNNQEEATQGATGWRGDRYLVFDTPNGRGIAWATTWETREKAANFYQLMQRVIEARKRSTPTRSMTVTTGEVSGRPVVLYADVPKGEKPNTVSLKDVTLGR
jgi:hypothetical protein